MRSVIEDVLVGGAPRAPRRAPEIERRPTPRGDAVLAQRSRTGVDTAPRRARSADRAARHRPCWWRRRGAAEGGRVLLSASSTFSVPRAFTSEVERRVGDAPRDGDLRGEVEDERGAPHGVAHGLLVLDVAHLDLHASAVAPLEALDTAPSTNPRERLSRTRTGSPLRAARRLDAAEPMNPPPRDQDMVIRHRMLRSGLRRRAAGERRDERERLASGRRTTRGSAAGMTERPPAARCPPRLRALGCAGVPEETPINTRSGEPQSIEGARFDDRYRAFRASWRGHGAAGWQRRLDVRVAKGEWWRGAPLGQAMRADGDGGEKGRGALGAGRKRRGPRC